MLLILPLVVHDYGKRTLSVNEAVTLGATLDVTGATGIDGDFDIATNKFTVASGTGNTTVAGTLDITGATTLLNTLTVSDLDHSFAGNVGIGTTNPQQVACRWCH